MKAARRSTEADTPRLVQASLDPTGAVRDAGAVAYNLLLAQEGREPPSQADAAPPAPAPAAPAVKIAPPAADAAPAPAPAAAVAPTA